MVTAVEVCRPERGVLKGHTRNLCIPAVREINQTGTLLVFVRTLWIPAAAEPESFPIRKAVAVNHTAAANLETIITVGVDQRGKIFATLTFYAGRNHREVADVAAALQFCSLLQVEFAAWTEEQGTAQVGATGYHHCAAKGGGFVYCFLDGCSLNQS